MFFKLEMTSVSSNKIFFMIILFKKITIFLMLIAVFFLPSLAPAFAADATVTRLVNPIGGELKKGGNPEGNINIPNIVGDAIKVALGIIGSITLLVFVYGGYQFLTSAGNSEKVHTGTSAMLYAAIGLFIIFGAYAILGTILAGMTKNG